VTIDSARAITEGWCNSIAVNPRIMRCTADDGSTVVVKMRRPPDDPRRDHRPGLPPAQAVYPAYRGWS